MFREGRQVQKERRRDPNKYEKILSNFNDFSSIFRPKIDPGTLPRTNNGKNGKTRLKILVFLGSGENFGRPEVSGRFQRAPKSHFLGVQKAGRKKGGKKNRIMRPTAQCAGSAGGKEGCISMHNPPGFVQGLCRNEFCARVCAGFVQE